MSDEILAHGTKLKMGDGADPEVFIKIGRVGDFSDGDTTDLVDVTSHDSGFYKEYIADVADRDEISFVVNYVAADATHNETTGIKGKRGQELNFQIEAPGDVNGTQFRAVVTAIGRSYPVQGGALQMNVTLKPVGAPIEYVIA